MASKSWTTSTPYRARPYFSVDSEAAAPVDTHVTGDIPAWLKGSLLRNGPGKYEVGEEIVGHLFDGLALMHRFTIFPGGRVEYQSKFLRSDVYHKAERDRRLTFEGFATRARHADPCKTLFQRVASVFSADVNDNCPVAFTWYGEDLFAVNETPKIWKIDPRTMDTNESVTLSDYVSINTITVHPQYDNDGTTYNIGTQMGKGCQYHLIKLPKAEKGVNPWSKATILASLQSSSFFPSYYHSFGLSENYFIFVEQSMKIHILKALFRNFMGATMLDSMTFDPGQPMHFWLIHRATGKVIDTHYEAATFFAFHHINAYERDNHVLVDICCYEDADIMNATRLERARQGGLPEKSAFARRFVIPLSVTKVAEDENLVKLKDCQASATMQQDGSVFLTPYNLCDITFEAPAINYADYNGQEYRYIYGQGEGYDHLMKVDAQTGEVWTWKREHCWPSEPIFVGAPSKSAEDDGVILSVVVDVSDERNPPFLLVLDAQTFQERARAVVPDHVQIPGVSFHGIFFREPETSLQD